MKGGFIKVYRSVFEHKMFTGEPYSKMQSWLDLIYLANWEENTISRQGIKIILLRGDIGWGEVELSKRWQWSRGKVRRFINDLILSQMVERKQYNPRDKRTSVLSICNYDTYQNNPNGNGTGDGTGNGTGDGTGDSTKEKKYKSIKKEKNSIYGSVFLDRFNEVTDRRFRVLDDKAKRQLNARVKEGFTVDEIINAAKACKNDEYHKEHPSYLTPEFITRSDKLQRFLNLSKSEELKPKKREYNLDDPVEYEMWRQEKL